MTSVKNRLVVAAFLIATSALMTSSAFADTAVFTEYEHGSAIGSFELKNGATSTTPIYFGMYEFTPIDPTGIFVGEKIGILINDSGNTGFVTTGHGSSPAPDQTYGFWADGFWGNNSPSQEAGFSGAMNAPAFYTGTYSGYDYYQNTSATLTISNGTGPKAPAPLLGGGLLSAFAALAAFGMTRLSRKDAGLI